MNLAYGTGIFAPGMAAKGGKIGGAKKSERKTSASRANGARSRTRHDSAKQAERGRRGARSLWSDPVAREMARARGKFALGVAKKGGRASAERVAKMAASAAHQRWHVQRGMRSKTCPLCTPTSL